MRVLGVDLGKARIGLAVMETELGVATPRKALNAFGSLARDAEQVGAAAKAEEAERVVVGLPLEDGAEGKAAGVMRRFGGLLEEAGFIVEYVDETLSSREADSAMFEAGLKSSQRKRAIDSEAACLILERYREGL